MSEQKSFCGAETGEIDFNGGGRPSGAYIPHGSHMSRYHAYDLLSDGETSQYDDVFTARKLEIMSMNSDTIRDRLDHRNIVPRAARRR